MSETDYCRKLGLNWKPTINLDTAMVLCLPDGTDADDEETNKVVEEIYNAHLLIQKSILRPGEKIKQFKILGDGAYSLGKYGPAFYYYKMMYNIAKKMKSTKFVEIHSYVRTCESKEEYKDAFRYYNEVYELVKEVPELAYDVMCNYAAILAQAEEPYDEVEHACAAAMEAAFKLSDVDNSIISVLKSLMQYQRQYKKTYKLEKALKMIKRLQFDENEKELDTHTVRLVSSDNQEQQQTHVEGTGPNDCSISDVEIEPTTLNIEINETASSTSKLHQSALDKRVIPKRNAKGENQLHIACLNYNTEAVRRLVMVDMFPVNFQDDKGWTALQIACEDGNVEIVEILINNGADVNAVNYEGATPMMSAAYKGHFNIVEILVKKGASCVIKTNSGFTVLDCMDDWIKYKKGVGKNKLNLYKKLRKTIQDIIKNSTINDSESVTCEPLPSKSGITANNKNNDEGNLDKNKKECISKPLDSRTNDNEAVVDTATEADVEMRSVHVDDADENITSVPTAGLKSTVMMSKYYYFRALGLNWNSKTNPDTVTLDLPDEVDGNSNEETNNIGADANNCTASNAEEQPSPLNNKINETTKPSGIILRSMVEKPKVIPIVNRKGENQLHDACVYDYCVETVRRLVMVDKFPVNLKDNEDWTALHIACHFGNVEIVEILINNGADVNAVNCNGLTPMMSAANKGHFNIVEILFENGASCLIKCNDGFTVLDYMDDWIHFKKRVGKNRLNLYKKIREPIEDIIKNSTINDSESVTCEPLPSTSGITSNNKNNDEVNVDKNKKECISKPLDSRTNDNEAVVDTATEADVEMRSVHVDDANENITSVPIADSQRSKEADNGNKLENDDTFTVIAKLVVIDGIPLQVIVSSEAIKELLAKAGYENIPKSINDVKNIIKSKTIQLEEKAKQNLKHTSGDLLSLTLDELILGPDHKYLDVKIYTTNNRVPDRQINLGLLRIKESDTVNDSLNNLKEKLAYFDLSLDKDIGCITTNNTNVLANIIKNVKCLKLNCFADRIRGAIIKVLYNNANYNTSQSKCTIDENLATGDADNSEIDVSITKNNTSNQMSSKTDIELIEILRKVVNFMKVYSTKTEDKNLIFNCKNNWSALTDLLGSFLELYNIMVEVDKPEININCDDINVIDKLWHSLVCIRNKINLFYNAEIDIAQAQFAVNCILRDLKANQCNITSRLRSKIRQNFEKQKDSILLSAFFRLFQSDFSVVDGQANAQSRIEIYNRVEYSDVFSKILDISVNLFNVLKDYVNKDDIINENFVEKPSLAGNLNDQSKLNSKVGSYNDYINQIHIEIELWQQCGDLDNTKYLKLICNFLKCIPATSISKEKVFSTRDVIDNNLKCSYDDDINETLGLLRYCYLQDK